MAGTPTRIGNELYEFGPFRMDPQRQILLRGDEPVPLTPKTFQVLLVLVRKSQQVVTKDDLMNAVWPDTFVDEANLSRNIFMLRKALGESAQDHQYIVTVPGRGYRLASGVRLAQEFEPGGVAAEHTGQEDQVKKTKPWLWIALVATLLIAIAAVTLRLAFHRSPILTEKDTLVLAEFANSTGDAVFDGTLRQGLAVQLEQSPFLSLVSEQRIQQVVRMMGQPADARLTPEIAREVCERTASAAVLEGSIAKLGNEYVLGLRARNCRTGDALDEEQVQAARKEDVLNALSQIASKFRTRVGESVTTVEKHNTPLAEATTPSLEALRAYSAGRRLVVLDHFQEAIPSLKRAIEIDPSFAMAYAALARVYGDTGESALSVEAANRAYELRDRVTEKEKFFITLNYHRQVTGNLLKAEETLQLWTQAYPRDADAHSLWSGFSSQGLGKYLQAIDEANLTVGLNPDNGPPYVNLAAANLYLDRFNEVESALRRASDRHLDSPDFMLLRYYMAFLQSDEAVMQREITHAQGLSEAEDWIPQQQAFVLASYGQLRQSRSITEQALQLAEKVGRREPMANYQAGAAVTEALFGNLHEAKREATAALDLSSARDVEYAAAFALALSGNSARAEALAADLEERFPENTSVRFNYSPTLRALLDLNTRQPRKALERLQYAKTYELAANELGLNNFYGNLYPFYVRGNAYLALGQGAEAAHEFQTILDHRGLVLADPVGPVARLQLARAYAMTGDTAKARAAYQDFLTLWEDADPDIPVFRQAKAEYTALQ